MSNLADVSGGNVERVNPTTLTKDFASMMAMPVIASNVVTKIKIHKALRFRNEDEGALNEDKTLLVRELGNVT